MKIVFFGDSLVWGGYGGNFVAEVAARLPQHQIINAGEGGDTVLNLLARLDDILALEPDGIFVIVGGNDAISYSQPATRWYYEHARNVPGGIVTPDDFSRAYRDLLTRTQVAHVLAWAALEPTEYNPETVSALQQFNQLVRTTAEALHIPVLDLMSKLAPAHVPSRPPLNQAFINLIGKRSASGWSNYEGERQRGGYTYSFDGLHLTPETARQVAGWMVEMLTPHLDVS